MLSILLSIALATQPYSEIVKRYDWKQQRVECLITLACLELSESIIRESLRHGLRELADKEVATVRDTVLHCNCREFQLLLFPLFDDVTVENIGDRMDSARIKFRMMSHEMRYEIWNEKQFRKSI